MTETLLKDYRYPFISKLRLRNFKSVTEGDIGMAPLTLLVGENSSGKSTILRALFLMRHGLPDYGLPPGVGQDDMSITDISEPDDVSRVSSNKSTAPPNTVSIGVDIRRIGGRGVWGLDIDWNPSTGIDEISFDPIDDDMDNSEYDLLCNKVLYVGPLRKSPGGYPETRSNRVPSDVGKRGEFTANLLAKQGDEVTGLPMPGDRVYTIKDILRSWVTDLGLAADVRVAGVEARLHWFDSVPLVVPPNPQIEVRPHGLDSFLPLSSVGVGVSQLLPVLVQCLLAEPGSVILLEQPELHLHPALQQRLTDFFIAVVRSGRQLIVETHSEYMVSRLRRRIVEDADDELLDLANVIFAERDRETGLTSYREVELSPLGAIEDWPAGFFDQAAEEERAIILGGVRKLKRMAAERRDSVASST